jgi:hypothetical protein
MDNKSKSAAKLPSKILYLQGQARWAASCLWPIGFICFTQLKAGVIMAANQSSNRSRASYQAKVHSQLSRIQAIRQSSQPKPVLVSELRSLIQLTQAHKA